MKITVEFENEDEFEAFRTSGKKTRGRKAGEKDDAADAGLQAPQLAQPQTGQAQGFNPQAGGGFVPQGATAAAAPGFVAPAAQVDPNIPPLVQRINVRIDGAIASGQQPDQVLLWFRQQCGPEAANATLDQIKQQFLYKLPLASLENIAKLMSA